MYLEFHSRLRTLEPLLSTLLLGFRAVHVLANRAISTIKKKKKTQKATTVLRCETCSI